MDASPKPETATEQSPQRKRGRPPKRKRLNNKIVEDAVPNADPEENVPKRKRGRPPGSTKKKLDKAARKDSTREVNIPYRYSPSPVENKMKAEAEDEADHPRKRGRPLGSTKRPPGSVPKKRGRPPGSSKRLPSSDTVAATPRKRGRPLGSTKRPPADPNMPTPVSRKRGRPPGSKSRSLYSILDAAFSKRRRKSPESSSPSRRRAAAFSPPDNAPNVSLEEAMKELETVYGRIPAESLSRFHRTNMQAVYRLLEFGPPTAPGLLYLDRRVVHLTNPKQIIAICFGRMSLEVSLQPKPTPRPLPGTPLTDRTFTRDDSPRTDEPLPTTP